METKIKVGVTNVRVMYVGDDGKTSQIHEGTVIQDFGSFWRVHNSLPVSRGGELNGEMAEVFAVAGRRCYCEIIGERKYPLTIPPMFRF